MKTYAFFALFVELSFFSNAQVTQGGLEGRLTNPEGNPIESASVSVTSPSLQGTKGTATLVNGFFKISSLPVGEYRMEISHVSYSSLITENIKVGLGLTANLGEIKLQAKITDLETVVVSGDKYHLSSSTAVESNITQATMNTLPIDRDFKSAIMVLPQVNPSYYGDLPNMGGATGSENYLFIDGLNVTDNNDVSSSISLPYNFIKEIQVKQGGYEAQYGGSIGGLVNAVTQSGTNKAKGQAFAFFTNSGLAKDPKTDSGFSSSSKNFQNYDIGASYGGPIIKDKLWYFVAYNFNRKQQDREIVGHGFFQDRTEISMFAAKLSWKPSENTDISFSIIGDPTVSNLVKNTDLSGTVPSVVANPDALLQRLSTGGIYSILSGQTRINPTLFANYSLYGYNRRLLQEGQTTIGTNQPMMTDQSVPNVTTLSGGIGITQDNDLHKVGASASLTKLVGGSTIKVGVMYEENGGQMKFDVTSPGFIIKNSNTDYLAIKVNQNVNPKNITPSAFVQGTFKVSEKLEVSSGLRWDGWFLYNGKESLQTMQLLQPRMGFNYAIGPQSKSRIFASYSLLYQQLPLYITPSYFITQQILRFYGDDPRIPGTQPIDSAYLAPPDKAVYKTNPHQKPDYSSEYVLGFESITLSGLRFGIKGIYRNLENAYISGFDPVKTFVGGNAGQGDLAFLPPVERTYAALEFTLQGDGAMRRLNYNFSYVLSKNYGNYTGYFDQDLGRQSQPGNSQSLTLEQQGPNSMGYMPNDRTHTMKLYGGYTFDFGLTAGISAIFMTGNPLNEYKYDSLGLQRPVYIVPRGSAGRLPSLYDISVRLSYKHPRVPGRLLLDFFHVGSPQQIALQDQLKFIDPQATKPNPNFGRPIYYQPPMFVRVGFEFDF